MEEIKKCLRTITAPGDAKPGELGKSLQRLDEIAKEAGSGLHPRLRHFLENRSYGKALLWLEDGEPEKGVCGAENFGDSPFSDLDSIGLPEAAPGVSEKTGKPRKPKVEERMGSGERLEVRREKSGRGGKTVTTIAGFPPRVNSKMRMSLLKRMKTSLGTGGTWNGSCMELQGDKRSEVVHWLSSLGFKPILAGG